MVQSQLLRQRLCVLPIAGQRHDHVAVAVVGACRRPRSSPSCRSIVNVFSGSSTLRKSITNRGSSVIGDLRAVVGDRQLDARLADLGRLAGEHQRAVAEREIDAAAFFAGDDRRLADGRVSGPTASSILLRRCRGAGRRRANGEAAFEQPRVDRRPRAVDEDLVAADGDLHFAVGSARWPARSAASRGWGRS